MVVFEKLSMPYFDRIPKMYQKDEACFMFVQKGEFSVRTPTEYISFRPGNAVLAKCFDYFFETSNQQQNSSDYMEVLGVMLYPSLVEELFQFELSTSNHSTDFNVKKIEVDALLENFRHSIDILIENPEIADEAIIRTKLKEFILLLSKTVQAPSELDFLAGMFKINRDSFKSIIQQNMFSNLSLQEFATLCNMSLSSFKRKFNEVYNESPKKFISLQKMKKAEQLLTDPKNRISDIAFDCGYDSVSSFNRNFKSLFGESPSQFRLNQNDQQLS